MSYLKFLSISCFLGGVAIRHSPFDVKTKGIIKQSNERQMEEKKSSILLLVCTLVMATMLVLLYAQEKKLYDYKKLVSSIDYTTIVTTDTVYETKTLTDTVPQYITRWKTKTYTLFKENDTIPHVVQLKGKTYSNTITDDNDTIEYQAHVSGYDVDGQEYPRLDSIEFTLKRLVTQTNTTSTQVVKVPQKRQFITTSPSITVGYDPLNKQWGAMVGVSLNFNVWNK